MNFSEKNEKEISENKNENLNNEKNKKSRIVSGKSQDSDQDGIPDIIEYSIGTDPYNAFTDSDLLNDGEEYYTYGTDPLSADTENDLIYDYTEVMVLGTDPLCNGTAALSHPGTPRRATSYLGTHLDVY